MGLGWVNYKKVIDKGLRVCLNGEVLKMKGKTMKTVQVGTTKVLIRKRENLRRWGVRQCRQSIAYDFGRTTYYVGFQIGKPFWSTPRVFKVN